MLLEEYTFLFDKNISIPYGTIIRTVQVHRFKTIDSFNSIGYDYKKQGGFVQRVRLNFKSIWYDYKLCH